MFATYLHEPSAGERRDMRTAVLFFSGALPCSGIAAERVPQEISTHMMPCPCC